LQAPPEERVVDSEVAKFKHAICVIVNCELPEIVAESRISEVNPMLETSSVWLPLCPLKPMVGPAENSTTGAATLMGVTLLNAVTVGVSVTVIVSLSVTYAGVMVEELIVSVSVIFPEQEFESVAVTVIGSSPTGS